MKRETAKMCVIIGVIILLMYLVIMFVFGLNEVGDRQGGFIGLFVFGGIVLLIIGWRGWNSEKREMERQELREAQLKAMKKGKTTVEIKGKMKKLK